MSVFRVRGLVWGMVLYALLFGGVFLCLGGLGVVMGADGTEPLDVTQEPLGGSEFQVDLGYGGAVGVDEALRSVPDTRGVAVGLDGMGGDDAGSRRLREEGEELWERTEGLTGANVLRGFGEWSGSLTLRSLARTALISRARGPSGEGEEAFQVLRASALHAMGERDAARELAAEFPGLGLTEEMWWLEVRWLLAEGLESGRVLKATRDACGLREREGGGLFARRLDVLCATVGEGDLEEAIKVLGEGDVRSRLGRLRVDVEWGEGEEFEETAYTAYRLAGRAPPEGAVVFATAGVLRALASDARAPGRARARAAERAAAMGLGGIEGLSKLLGEAYEATVFAGRPLAREGGVDLWRRARAWARASGEAPGSPLWEEAVKESLSASWSNDAAFTATAVALREGLASLPPRGDDEELAARMVRVWITLGDVERAGAWFDEWTAWRASALEAWREASAAEALREAAEARGEGAGARGEGAGARGEREGATEERREGEEAAAEERREREEAAAEARGEGEEGVAEAREERALQALVERRRREALKEPRASWGWETALAAINMIRGEATPLVEAAALKWKDGYVDAPGAGRAAAVDLAAREALEGVDAGAEAWEVVLSGFAPSAAGEGGMAGAERRATAAASSGDLSAGDAALLALAVLSGGSPASASPSALAAAGRALAAGGMEEAARAMFAEALARHVR